MTFEHLGPACNQAICIYSTGTRRGNRIRGRGRADFLDGSRCSIPLRDPSRRRPIRGRVRCRTRSGSRMFAKRLLSQSLSSNSGRRETRIADPIRPAAAGLGARTRRTTALEMIVELCPGIVKLLSESSDTKALILKLKMNSRRLQETLFSRRRGCLSKHRRPIDSYLR